MTNIDALDDVFNRFDEIQFAVVEGLRYCDGAEETFLLSFGQKDNNIALLISTDVMIPVKLYLLRTVSSTKEKLKWVLDKYQLVIKSIVEVYDINMKNINVKTFNENNIMCYSFSLLNLNGGRQVGIRFETYVDDINLQQFIADYYNVVDMLTSEEPRYSIEIVGENPIAYARRIKLKVMDVE